MYYIAWLLHKRYAFMNFLLDKYHYTFFLKPVIKKILKKEKRNADKRFEAYMQEIYINNSDEVSCIKEHRKMKLTEMLQGGKPSYLLTDFDRKIRKIAALRERVKVKFSEFIV